MRTLHLALLLLLAAPSIARADDAPLRVQTDAAVDTTALVTLLSTELSRPVVSVDPGAACQEPCLVVDVADDGATVSVAFTSADGAWRERSVQAPQDAAALVETVVLLAGNLVRDEAAVLVQALAPEEVAEPVEVATPVVEVAPVSEIQRERRPGTGTGTGTGEGLGLRTIGVGFGGHHAVSIGLVVGVSSASDLAAISAAVDVSTGRVNGLQLAGAVAAARHVNGLQIGGAVATASDINGTQIAGAVTAARDVRGAQIAGAVAAGRDVGVQIAGAVNVARDAGVQISGAVNVARRARVQVGIINVAHNRDVLAIGLIDIVPGGRTDVETSVDSDALGTVLLRHGGSGWHNVYGVGGRRDEGLWMYGLGMGGAWHAGRLAIDLEAMAWQVNHDTWHDDHLSLLSQLRLTLGLRLGALTAVAGVVANGYLHSEQRPRGILFSTSGDPGGMTTDTALLRIWPTAFAGVRF